MEGDFRVGQWLVQPKLNDISGNGKAAHIEPKAMQVLVYLAEHAGDVMPKERIIQAVWADTFVTDDVLTRSVSELRKAFEDDPHEARFIQTIPKGGYRLIAPVSAVAAVSPPPPRTAVGDRRYRVRLALALVSLAVLTAVTAYLGRHGFGPKAQPPAGKIRLVVLPFENLSGDPEQEYFSDGITEEMTTQLGQLSPERLAVIGRASAMTYKGRKKTIDEIGKELRVQYVLEGSARHVGGHVRITAQLIEVGDQTHVWAQSYDRDMRDILALQNDVARAVAREVKLTLTPASPAPVSDSRPLSPQGYELYLRGRYYWNKRTPESVQRSLEYFKKTTEQDPHSPLGYTGLALAYLVAPVMGLLSRKEAYPKAMAAARTALNMDDAVGEAHAVLAAAEVDNEWNWENAEREFKRALQIDPGNATTHHWYGFTFLLPQGRVDEAFAELKRALEMDPLSLIINTNLADAYQMTRQHERAIEQARRTLDLDDKFMPALTVLGKSYTEAMRHQEAIEVLQRAAKLSERDPQVWARMGYAFAVAGNRKEALESLRRLEELGKRVYVPPYNVALVHAGLGDKDQTFKWLEKAYDEQSFQLRFVKLDPPWDGVRSDPRFQDLLRRMNFPP